MSEINKEYLGTNRIPNSFEGLNRYLTNNPTESELKNRIGFLFVGETARVTIKETKQLQL